MVLKKRFLLLAILFPTALGLRAQTDSLLVEGDSLHREYRFAEAMERYARASARTADTDTIQLLRSRMDLSQNALNMTDFCADPVVVARERFSRKDFFLFYPLKNKSWRLPPHALDPSDDGFPAYVPPGGLSLCFSAPDATGFRNLYVSAADGSTWSYPELMGELLLSPGNEVFPMLSEDGKTLTFSSDGLHGMGGYDLYRSTWDEETGTWSEPMNMGFPYSSPGDDFLLVDSPDGRYTLFASNRDCPPDSVYIYVTEKQPIIVRSPMHDPAALARVAALTPLDDPTRMDHGAAVADDTPDNGDSRRYMQMTAEARVLRDSIYRHERILDSLRVRLSAGTEDRTALTSAVAEREAALAPLRRRLDETSHAIRNIELSFLQRGAVSDTDRTDREVVGARHSYTFSKNALGAKLKLSVAPPPPTAPATFQVGPVGRFGQESNLPKGVIYYQIQLFTSPRHATVDELKGLDPVYERLTRALRYTYSVGVFNTYNEALLQLNPVRVLGFPEAEIVAYLDGKPIAVSLARRSEATPAP